MGAFTHTTSLDRVKSKDLYLISSSPLPAISYFLITTMLNLLLSSTNISILTALLMLPTTWFLYSHGITTKDILLSLIPILSTSLMQELTRILNHSSLSIVNWNTFRDLYFLLPKTWILSRDTFFQGIYLVI